MRRPAEARAVVAAFALPENDGKGAIALDGRMVERLHLAEADGCCPGRGGEQMMNWIPEGAR